MEDDIPLVTSEEAVRIFGCFQALTRSIRNARAEYNVEPGKRISAVIVATKGNLKMELEKELKSLIALARLDPDKSSIVDFDSEEGRMAMSEKSVRLVVQDGVEAYLPLSGLIDPVKERKRLEKQQEKLGIEIMKLSSRLNSKGFVDKAPMSVVEKAREELAELEDQAKKVETSLEALPV